MCSASLPLLLILNQETAQCSYSWWWMDIVGILCKRQKLKWKLSTTIECCYFFHLLRYGGYDWSLVPWFYKKSTQKLFTKKCFKACYLFVEILVICDYVIQIFSNVIIGCTLSYNVWLIKVLGHSLFRNACLRNVSDTTAFYFCDFFVSRKRDATLIETFILPNVLICELITRRVLPTLLITV